MKPPIFIILLLIGFTSCNSSRVNFTCGQAYNKKEIKKSFAPVMSYLDLKPGETFADIGAASGTFDAILAYMVDSVHFYIQDIDTSCLNQDEWSKILTYYSGLKQEPLDATNNFDLVIGEGNTTNLPKNTFDKIITNGTFHLFSNPDLILQDIYQKLKPGGILFVRDDFNQEGEHKECEKCQVPLVNYERFLKLMSSNGYKLVEISPRFGPYPIHKFMKK